MAGGAGVAERGERHRGTERRQDVRHLQELATGLGAAVTVDDVARASLTSVLALPPVVRAGFAVTEAAGREFRFVASDQDALSPVGVRWCTVDALSDLPLPWCM